MSLACFYFIFLEKVGFGKTLFGCNQHKIMFDHTVRQKKKKGVSFKSSREVVACKRDHKFFFSPIHFAIYERFSVS